MKLYKHELLTKYPTWEEEIISIDITKDEVNPFSMVTFESEMARIMENVELSRQLAAERGLDPTKFALSWYHQMSQEYFDELTTKDIGLEIGTIWEGKIAARAITIDDFIALEKLFIVIPEQLYAMTEIELDDEFINLVDQYEAIAQASWSGYDPEPFCQRQYNAAMRYAKTSDEIAYVESREWC